MKGKTNPVAKYSRKYNKSTVQTDRKKAMKRGYEKHKKVPQESVEEKLKVSDGMGAWIRDFQDSEAPQFKGKDEKKRKEMAIAAYMSAKKEAKTEGTIPNHADQQKKANMTASDKDKLSKVAALMKKQPKAKNESVEINELSPKTMRSYVTKASDARGHRKLSTQKQDKRYSGIATAQKKLSKEAVKEPTGDLKDACWKGYTAVGTKKKNGRTVPNCVPKEDLAIPIQRSNVKTKKSEQQKNKPFTQTEAYGWNTKKTSDGYEWQVTKTEFKKPQQIVAKGKSTSRAIAVSAAKKEVMKYRKSQKEETMNEKYSWNDVNKALTKANYMRGNPAHISRVARQFDHKSGNDKNFTLKDVKKNLSAAGISPSQHHDIMKHMSESNIDELSNATLSSYKTKAAAQASAADKKGDYKKADKRFSGITKATNKQFANDAKKHESVEVEESTFKVKVNGMPTFYVDGKSAADIKVGLRKKLRTPDDLVSVERVPDVERKKDYRARIKQKTAAEPEEMGEEFNFGIREELTPMQKRKHMNLKKRAASGNAQAKKRLDAFEKEMAADLKMSKGSAGQQKSAATKGASTSDQAGDAHLIMQLRKAQDVNGNMPIKVSPTKSVKLNKKTIDNLLAMHDKATRPDQKRKFRIHLTKKLRSM